MDYINLWLDDLRPAPEGFIWCINITELTECLLLYKGTGWLNTLSLDHDLGEEEFTGYDFTKWLVEYGFEHPEVYPKQIYLHTANPVGRKNMYELLMRYKPDYVKVHRSPMPFE